MDLCRPKRRASSVTPASPWLGSLFTGDFWTTAVLWGVVAWHDLLMWRSYEEWSEKEMQRQIDEDADVLEDAKGDDERSSDE